MGPSFVRDYKRVRLNKTETSALLHAPSSEMAFDFNLKVRRWASVHGLDDVAYALTRPCGQ